MTTNELCKIITDRVTAEMEKGIIPWERPWTGTTSGAISGATGKPYSLLNQILLLNPGRWYTFSQAKSLGGSIRKGEHGSWVVFWKQILITTQDLDNEGKPIKKIVPMLKYYNVFHESQIDGLPEYDPAEVVPAHDPIAEADAIEADYISRSGVRIEHCTSNEAYYSPTRDCIVTPTLDQFPRIEEYYSTLYHEMTHSTGHSSRLNRLTGSAHFGDQEYSKEELVAEIGAAALLHSVGIQTAHSTRNTAAYLQSWLKALRADPTMLVHAAGKAAKAVAYILGTEETAPTGTDDDSTTQPEAVPAPEAVAASQPEAAAAAPAASAKKARKPSGRRQAVAAVNRIMKSRRKLSTNAFGYADLYNGMQVVSDGYRAVCLREHIPDLPALPDDITPINWEKFLTTPAETQPISVPESAALKEWISRRKDEWKSEHNGSTRSMPDLVYDFGPGKPVVNAAYLLDILEALPGSAAVFSTPLAGIHFQADTGTGLLMPVRPAKNISRQTTDLTI